jgi:hypothetical protein
VGVFAANKARVQVQHHHRPCNWTTEEEEDAELTSADAKTCTQTWGKKNTKKIGLS